MIRVFLDANILFSAAYREGAGLTKLWHSPKIRLVSSDYAIEEARRNLSDGGQRERLEELVATLERVATVHPALPLPKGLTLHEKDQPILSAAVGARCAFLVTGDSDFEDFFGHTVHGVTVLRARDFLALKKRVR